MFHAGRLMLVFIIIFSFDLFSTARSQDAEPVYVIAYLEVDPAALEEVEKLLRQYRAGSQRESGNLQFEVLQRIHRPSHFSFFEAWQNGAAQAVHASSENTESFHSLLKPYLTSSYDERKHLGLTVMGNPSLGTIFVVTHIDIIPPRREEGVVFVEEMVKFSRADDGNVRFNALVQSNRTNHLTLVEEWQDEESWEAHVVSQQMREMRRDLLLTSGALYDERLFRQL